MKQKCNCLYLIHVNANEIKTFEFYLLNKIFFGENHEKQPEFLLSSDSIELCCYKIKYLFRGKEK